MAATAIVARVGGDARFFAPPPVPGHMATEDTPDATGERRLRTVTGIVRGRPDAEMDAIGWLILVVLAVLFLPLAPFVLLLWLLSRLSG